MLRNHFNYVHFIIHLHLESFSEFSLRLIDNLHHLSSAAFPVRSFIKNSLFVFKHFYYISFPILIQSAFLLLAFVAQIMQRSNNRDLTSLLLLFPFQLRRMQFLSLENTFCISLLLFCLEVISCALLNDKISANSEDFWLISTASPFPCAFVRSSLLSAAVVK